MNDNNQLITINQNAKLSLIKSKNLLDITRKILDKKENLSWDYDEEADVLYISIGEPQKAVGVDIGEGAVVRYREDTGEVVGLTLIGVKERLLNSLKKN